MTERETKIIKTAMWVFSQYGYKRATMNDIATEAGMARQTLYNTFANKEDVLRACILYFYSQIVLSIKTGAQNCTSATDVLELILEEISLKPYRMLSQSKHADEIIDGFKQLGATEMAEGIPQVIDVIQKSLIPYQQASTTPEITMPALADFIFSSAYSAKGSADDETHLLSLLNTLKLLVLKVL